ncbi:MAG: hypothetical protein COT74_02090 [Bdellovibrionales bacterium CG10_big_fil_rev_8_21_14_0_10_45_34]|nr:MAG: hypothetical protein COT74_02090 [Bdellovibrionales bacterium CG10_big_fil_rev_8_21_14_0_10_45_34]
MNELVTEFIAESETALDECLKILEEIEGNFEQVKRLEDVGQIIDRVMGGAKNMALLEESHGLLSWIGDAAELCKIVAYRGSQIRSHADLFNLVSAFLIDTVEVLQEQLRLLPSFQKEATVEISRAFLDRLSWVKEVFSPEFRSSVKVSDNPSLGGGKTVNQDEIDELLKRLTGS